jgi:hypothetical protein
MAASAKWSWMRRIEVGWSKMIRTRCSPGSAARQPGPPELKADSIGKRGSSDVRRDFNDGNVLKIAPLLFGIS